MCHSSAGRDSSRALCVEDVEVVMKYAWTLLIAGALAAMGANREVTAVAAQSCESLAILKLPHTTITLAQTVGPGAFTPPPAASPPPGRVAAPADDVRDLPAFCRVAAT